MKATRTEQIEQIRALLARHLGASVARGRSAETVWEMLSEGAGEEPLVERLDRISRTEGGAASREPIAHDNLVFLARDLLRIGVLPQRGAWRQRKVGAEICIICEREVPFCWSCRCGFKICQECLEENRWGMTCNNITWECPDCGSFRSF